PAGLGHAFSAEAVAEVGHVVMEAGDRLFCVTDGITDSHRPGGKDFGEERLVDLLRETSGAKLDATETIRRLSHSVLDYHGVLSDDTTAFLIDFH
ncbi:MAG TPA: SpoIIE family protein phosphatase, partial [Nocardioides sp.]|nr:SpoIIE family protein phosphatase [Nocardioides sp.]